MCRVGLPGAELQPEGIIRGRFRGGDGSIRGPAEESTVVGSEGVDSSMCLAIVSDSKDAMGGQESNDSVLDIQESNLAIRTMSVGESERRVSRERPW